MLLIAISEKNKPNLCLGVQTWLEDPRGVIQHYLLSKTSLQHGEKWGTRAGHGWQLFTLGTHGEDSEGGTNSLISFQLSTITRLYMKCCVLCFLETVELYLHQKGHQVPQQSVKMKSYSSACQAAWKVCSNKWASQDKSRSREERQQDAKIAHGSHEKGGRLRTAGSKT